MRIGNITLSAPLGPTLRPRAGQSPSGMPEEREVTLMDVNRCDPMPADLDPFLSALMGGVDETARHQAMTLLFPILSFLGQGLRVDYGDGQLRWVCGQSWQMGGSGCGKSLMLRALEGLFLGREMEENDRSAREAAAYTLLPEKERKEKQMPKVAIRVFNAIPTAIALLEQIQTNGGGAVYMSCSECGEFSKKVSNPYYSIVLDMMKKAYDGTGEPFIHRATNRTYYAPSVKICANVGGTIDPMYGIFRRCNADGTLSRGCLTMLPGRKPQTSPYRTPSWSDEEKQTLWEGAERLRQINLELNETEKKKVYEETEKRLGVVTADALRDAVHAAERAKALRSERVLALGREIKEYVRQYGEMGDDCVSRADERAMGMCYLLLVANGACVSRGVDSDTDGSGVVAAAGDSAADVEERIVAACRWWIVQAVDCAVALQRQINEGVTSVKDGVRTLYKRESLKRASQRIFAEREAALREWESRHEGETLGWQSLQEVPALAGLSRYVLARILAERYISEKKGLYKIKRHEDIEQENK